MKILILNFKLFLILFCLFYQKKKKKELAFIF